MNTLTEDWMLDLNRGRIHRQMVVCTEGGPSRILLETVDPAYTAWIGDLDGYVASRDVLAELEPELVESFDRSPLSYLVAHDTFGVGARGGRYVDFATIEESLAHAITERIGGRVFDRQGLEADDPAGCADALALWDFGDDSRYLEWSRRRSTIGLQP